MSTCEQAIEILQKTNDGEKLAPKHLYLLQLAVNGELSPEGERLFTELHDQVTSGTYDASKVWYYGVEHMTKDHEGYIYYKGKHVDHYSFKDPEAEKRALIKLQRLCLLVESKGHEVNTLTTCWHVEEYVTPEELAQCAA